MLIPSDPLTNIFNQNVIAHLQKYSTNNSHVSHLLNVLSACGSSDEARTYRAIKAAWETYLEAAFYCGFFTGRSGSELRKRLTGKNQSDFRSAMSECMACWFFAGKSGLKVEPYPPKGRESNPLDMSVIFTNGRKAYVEVKAPLSEFPKSGVKCGDDSDKLDKNLALANKQFDKNRMNILFIAPQFQPPIFHSNIWKETLDRAFFGDYKIVQYLNTLNGEPIGEPQSIFYQEGRFLKPQKETLPGYTRVSAIIIMEEQLLPFSGYLAKMSHHSFAIYNPHAKHPLHPDYSKYIKTDKRYIPSGKYMKWELE